MRDFTTPSSCGVRVLCENHQTKKPTFGELFCLVNHRASQVETLFDVLEDIDPKLKTLGIIEVNGIMTHAADEQRANQLVSD